LLGGITSPKLEQYVGFWAAFLVPTCMFGVSLTVFISGRKLYVRVPPEGSVLVKAWRCWRSGMEANVASATIIEGADKSRYWDQKFVDELKQTFMACKIFVPMVIYWIAYSQINNNLISQAATMDYPPAIPNDIMSNIDPLALILLIPIMDKFVYPFLNKINFEFFAIRRITVGFFIGSAAMAWSAIVQHMIDTSPVKTVNVWWQIPSYFFIALSEIFASIASIEYSYTHAPQSMKSMVAALSLFPNAVASLIGIFLSQLAQPPYLVWMYVGIAIATAITGVLFWFFFHNYDQIDKENRLKKRQADEDIKVEV